MESFIEGNSLKILNKFIDFHKALKQDISSGKMVELPIQINILKKHYSFPDMENFELHINSLLLEVLYEEFYSKKSERLLIEELETYWNDAGLFDQLQYEGFSKEEAAFAAKEVGF